MSTKTLKDEKKLAKSVMISQRCLGILLKRIERNTPTAAATTGSNDEIASGSGENLKNGEYSGQDTGNDDWMFESGYLIFQEFQEENRQCFWNSTLVDSVNNVEYMGYVAPGTLLVCGNEYYLEALRSAWARRVLKPPANFVIKRLGDVTGLEMQVIPQTQFTPLPEALCLVISELNSENETASLEIIFSHLQERFSDMLVPNQEIVYASLGKLIKDRKVYHTGDGYFIVTPVTYHVTTMSALPERSLLMSNEEAIHKLHGGELLGPSRPTQTRTRSIQTNMDEFMMLPAGKSASMEYNLSPGKLERSGSLRLSRKDKHKSQDNGSFIRSESMRLSPEKSKSLIKDINLKSSPMHQNIEKGEKVSVFSKLFRRSLSKRRKNSKSPAKYSTFSAQFPPLEWGDPGIIHFHSRSTQTLEGRSASRDSRIPAPIITSSAVTTSPSPATNTLASQTSMKSKTDSLTRLRDHDKPSNRSRSSTLESILMEKSGEPASDRQAQRMSGLSRKIHSQSSVVQDSPNISPKKSSASNSPKKLLSSSSSSKTSLSSPAKGIKQQLHGSSDLPPNVTSASPTKDGGKISNYELKYQFLNDNLHSGAAILNKSDDAKVKNTEAKHDESYRLNEVPTADLALRRSGKCLNRWSVHGSEGLSGSPSRGPMNNVAASPRNKLTAASSAAKSPGIKCVNKLHSSSLTAGPQKHPSNVTVAVRPTQAIRPMNQNLPEKSTSQNQTSSDKVSNNGTHSSLLPSPSFNKSFDLESEDFKSITAHKLLKGISINSIDTLVEVNMMAESGNGTLSQQPSSESKTTTTTITSSVLSSPVKSPSSIWPLTKPDLHTSGLERGPILNNVSMVSTITYREFRPKLTKATAASSNLSNAKSTANGKSEVKASPEDGALKKQIETKSPVESTKVTALV